MTDDKTHEEKVDRALTDLVAFERDRLLGYHGDLHRNPRAAMLDALEVLVERGYNPDEIILPDDQEQLNLDLDFDQ